MYVSLRLNSSLVYPRKNSSGAGGDATYGGGGVTGGGGGRGIIENMECWLKMRGPQSVQSVPVYMYTRKTYKQVNTHRMVQTYAVKA